LDYKVIDNSVKATKHLQTTKNIDAILCEYNLPGNNGIFLYDWISAQSEFDTIPFILLVKDFNAEVYKTAFRKQIDDFIVISN